MAHPTTHTPTPKQGLSTFAFRLYLGLDGGKDGASFALFETPLAPACAGSWVRAPHREPQAPTAKGNGVLHLSYGLKLLLISIPSSTLFIQGLSVPSLTRRSYPS